MFGWFIIVLSVLIGISWIQKAMKKASEKPKQELELEDSKEEKPIHEYEFEGSKEEDTKKGQRTRLTMSVFNSNSLFMFNDD